MKEYLKLVSKILKSGTTIQDRTGVGVKSIFGGSLKFKLGKTKHTKDFTYIENFPVLTTKKMNFKLITSELIWFLRGSTNERELAEILYKSPRGTLKDKRTIWTSNVENQAKSFGYNYGELGPIYGYQWRRWKANPGPFNPYSGTREHDQIKDVIQSIKTDPFSRRHIVSAWNVGDLEKMSLPPCHVLHQYNVVPDKNNKPKYLDLMLFQRSADVGLGLPFNIASYALLMAIIADLTGLTPRELTIAYGNAHIYLNHIDQLTEQMNRTPKELPLLEFPRFQSFEDFLDYADVDKFILKNYDPHPAVKMEMAV